MMSFCKKSLHSLLGFSLPMDLGSDLKFKQPPPPLTAGGSGSGSVGSGGIGLITATSDSHKTPNVLESATLLNRPSSPPPTPTPTPTPKKKDPGGIGFIDEVGGGVDGLMSCTESLGFESCDERRVDDEIIQICCSRSRSESSNRKRDCGRRRRREMKEFPPPLSSLNHNGQPCFFLRPVRRDGRLELMEVRIDRPEILRASREDGRLRLHLVREETLDDFIEKEEEEEEEITENEEEEEEEIAEEERREEWRYAVAGEGMRCHEAVAHHRDLHVWSRHCVTTS